MSMKNLFYFTATLLSLGFAVSCGPAVEDRKMMHERAKVFQDSIANVIRTTMAEAEGPAPVTTPGVPMDTARRVPAPNQAK